MTATLPPSRDNAAYTPPKEPGAEPSAKGLLDLPPDLLEALPLNAASLANLSQTCKALKVMSREPTPSDALAKPSPPQRGKAQPKPSPRLRAWAHTAYSSTDPQWLRRAVRALSTVPNLDQATVLQHLSTLQGAQLNAASADRTSPPGRMQRSRYPTPLAERLDRSTWWAQCIATDATNGLARILGTRPPGEQSTVLAALQAAAASPLQDVREQASAALSAFAEVADWDAFEQDLVLGDDEALAKLERLCASPLQPARLIDCVFAMAQKGTPAARNAALEAAAQRLDEAAFEERMKADTSKSADDIRVVVVAQEIFLQEQVDALCNPLLRRAAQDCIAADPYAPEPYTYLVALADRDPTDRGLLEFLAEAAERVTDFSAAYGVSRCLYGVSRCLLRANDPAFAHALAAISQVCGSNKLVKLAEQHPNDVRCHQALLTVAKGEDSWRAGSVVRGMGSLPLSVAKPLWSEVVLHGAAGAESALGCLRYQAYNEPTHPGFAAAFEDIAANAKNAALVKSARIGTLLLEPKGPAEADALANLALEDRYALEALEALLT